MRHNGHRLRGVDTLTPVGVLASLTGNLGCGTAVQLMNALAQGKPTFLYLDEVPASDEYVEPYSDLTAEWYPNTMSKSGLLDTELEERGTAFDPERLDLETIEEWGRNWLRSEV